VQDLVLFIEKNLLKDLLSSENEEFEKKFKTLRNNLAESMSKLEKANAFANKKSASYSQLYASMITNDA
jgi:hypothetical protein